MIKSVQTFSFQLYRNNLKKRALPELKLAELLLDLQVLGATCQFFSLFVSGLAALVLNVIG